MNRLNQLSPEQMTPAQLEVYQSISAGPRGEVRGPFLPLIHSADMTKHIEKLGAYIRYESRVPERQRELAICMVGAAWQADFEWYTHAPLARKQGISDAALAQIAKGETPVLEDPLDQITFQLVNEVQKTRRVSDDTYGRAVELLDEQGVVDLVGLVGYYTLLAMTLNTFEVDVPADSDIPWKSGA